MPKLYKSQKKKSTSTKKKPAAKPKPGLGGTINAIRRRNKMLRDL